MCGLVHVECNKLHDFTPSFVNSCDVANHSNPWNVIVNAFLLVRACVVDSSHNGEQFCSIP